MCPRMTNLQGGAYDAHELSFESAGALAFVHEGAGPAGPPALSIAFAEPQLDISLLTTVIAREVTMTQAFAACIGIDWAAATHAICRHAAGSDPRASRVLEHTPEASDAGARVLRSRFGGRLIAVCVEWTNGPLGSARRTYDCCVLFPVTALTVAPYRQAFTPRRAQDAPSDAAIPLARLRKHRDQLQALTPPSAPMRALDQLVECRRRLVSDQGRLTTRLTSALKNYFAQLLPWFSAKDPTLFCDVLTPGPTLKAVHLARRAPRERFFRQHHVQTRVIAHRIQAINPAMPLTTDEGGITPPVCLVRALGAQRRATWQALEAVDRGIAPRAPTHPDGGLFPALPGAGPVFAPPRLGAVGEQRERVSSATALQQ